MKFKVGKFYIHSTGKMIAVLGSVVTYAWDELFIVEECNPVKGGIEHYISGFDKDSSSRAWVEIGKSEWMANFKDSGDVQISEKKTG